MVWLEKKTEVHSGGFLRGLKSGYVRIYTTLSSCRRNSGAGVRGVCSGPQPTRNQDACGRFVEDGRKERQGLLLVQDSLRIPVHLQCICEVVAGRGSFSRTHSGVGVRGRARDRIVLGTSGGRQARVDLIPGEGWDKERILYPVSSLVFGCIVAISCTALVLVRPNRHSLVRMHSSICVFGFHHQHQVGRRRTRCKSSLRGGGGSLVFLFIIPIQRGERFSCHRQHGGSLEQRYDFVLVVFSAFTGEGGGRNKEKS